MSETTEFKDVYEAIASVSPNRQNILYTVLEEDAFGEKAFFSDDKLVWESTKGGFFSQNQEEVGKLHDSGQATAAGKKLFCDCLGGEKRLVICGGGHVSMPVIQLGAAAARPVTLRANTLKATAEDIAAALDAAGIAHNPVAWYPDAFILPEAQVSDLWDLDIYRDGKIYLQSLSSMMPPLVLGAQAGEDILDMCAAPGGKTTQIAALTQGQAHLTACEMSIPRAEKLEANLGRQGAKNVPVMRIDARELDEFFRFDRILLDAPCTGTGTVISDNEKSLRGLTEQLLNKCARSQRALLDRALGALKPGGTLVYSTCSILPQENEDALQEALDKHMDCELIPLDGTPSESEARRAQEAGKEPRIESNALTEAIAAGHVSSVANGMPGTLTIPPSRDFEGFYIALIRKRS